MEAIILAGGLGTRLRGVIGSMPKCMAPVAGRPFLHYLLRYAAAQGVRKAVLSLGYESATVTAWLASQQLPLQIATVIEAQPLGTGGGIQLAMADCSAENVFVLNGDTMFQVGLQQMHQLHLRRAAETSLALKAMSHFNRYGTVQTDIASGRICSFQEKKAQLSGDINGGVYLINREAFLNRRLPQAFSFEHDYLERYVGGQRFYAHTDDAYFIDIGVPQDYAQAQLDFQNLFPT